MTALATPTRPGTSQESAELDFVLQKFVNETMDVEYAQLVSADGMHLAASRPNIDESHQTFAAIVSALTSLIDSSVTLFDLGTPTRQIIEASDGWILLSRISNTAAFGVYANENADIGLIGYEMAHLTKQLGTMLSPDVVKRLGASPQG